MVNKENTQGSRLTTVLNVEQMRNREGNKDRAGEGYTGEGGTCSHYVETVSLRCLFFLTFTTNQLDYAGF